MLIISEVLLGAQQYKKLYTKMILEAGAPFGLNKAESDLLLFLYNNPGHDTASEVVQMRGMAKSLVSKSADGLLEKGMIRAEEDQKDRRVVRLALEPKSNLAVKNLRKTQEDFFKLIYDGVSEEEKKTLELIFLKVVANIRKAL